MIVQYTNRTGGTVSIKTGNGKIFDVPNDETFTDMSGIKKIKYPSSKGWKTIKEHKIKSYE